MNTLKLKKKTPAPPSEALIALTDFLTGKMVAGGSIGLQLSGPMRIFADEFFKLRKAFGVDGYVSFEEALPAIKNKLGIK